MQDLPRPGQLIAGRYRADHVLGRGGMGLVMAAEDLALSRRVALKFLSSSNPDAGALRRFLREARLAAQLESEHVARVLDAATLPSGVPYIVMEHLRGANLKQVLQERGPLPPSEAVDYLIQACDAVAEAHALGIVHRDLKPSNLFLCERLDGASWVKVLDFGISKGSATAGAADALTDGDTTSRDVILGSPRYMAPEQIRCSRDADARSDIWSLGAILYELIAGAPPYQAETLPGLLAAIVADPPPALAACRSDVPSALEAVLHGCLQKDPSRRHVSVAALSAALAPFGSGASAALVLRIGRILGAQSGSRASRAATTAAPVEKPVAAALAMARQSRTLVAGAVLVGLAAVGSWSFLLGPERDPAVPPERPPPASSAATTDPNATQLIEPPAAATLQGSVDTTPATPTPAGAPARAEPAHVEPAHVEPAHVEPAHVEPAHVEPAHVKPAHVEPARAETARMHPPRRTPASAPRSSSEPLARHTAGAASAAPSHPEPSLLPSAALGSRERSAPEATANRQHQQQEQHQHQEAASGEPARPAQPERLPRVSAPSPREPRPTHPLDVFSDPQ